MYNEMRTAGRKLQFLNAIDWRFRHITSSGWPSKRIRMYYNLHAGRTCMKNCSVKLSAICGTFLSNAGLLTPFRSRDTATVAFDGNIGVIRPQRITSVYFPQH